MSSISRVVSSSPEVEVLPEINIFDSNNTFNNNSFNNNIFNNINNRDVPYIEIIDTDEIPISDSKKTSESLKSDRIDIPEPSISFESHFLRLFSFERPQHDSNVEIHSKLENQSKSEIKFKPQNDSRIQDASKLENRSKVELNYKPQSDSSKEVEHPLQSQNLAKSEFSEQEPELENEVHFKRLKNEEESEGDGDFEELIFAPDQSKLKPVNQVSFEVFVKDRQSQNINQNVESHFGFGFNQNFTEADTHSSIKREPIDQILKDFQKKSESYEFEEIIYVQDGDDDATSREMINPLNIPASEPSLISEDILDQISSKQIDDKNISIDNFANNNTDDSNLNGEII